MQNIGGYSDFCDSEITDLGELHRIGRDAYFPDSKVTDLKNLKEIGGKIEWGEREDLKRQWKDIQARLKMEVSGQEFGITGFESSSDKNKEAKNVLAEALGRENDGNIIGNNGEDW